MKKTVLLLLFSSLISHIAISQAENDCEACKGSINKQLTVNVPTGFTASSISWSHDNTITGATTVVTAAGEYTVTVIATDDNNPSCPQTVTYKWTIIENDTASIALQVVDNVCGNTDGTANIDATITGGTPPYTYQWIEKTIGAAQYGFAGTNYNAEDLELDINADTEKLEAPGIWELAVTDAKGCVKKASVELKPAPTPITLTGTCTDVNP